MAKHKKHDEEHMSEAWLIPYADVLTLLLALFIVLFASSQVDERKFTAMQQAFSIIFSGSTSFMDGAASSDSMIELPISSPEVNVNDATATTEGEGKGEGSSNSEQVSQEMQEIQEKVQQYIQNQSLTGNLEIKQVDGGLVITIKEKALFDSGSAEIRPEFLTIVGEIANILRGYNNVEVQVSGHTDNNPIRTAQFQDNWSLSSARALSVMRYLINSAGLDPMRYSAIGYGEFKPIATNDNSEGRAQNRRVEVSIRGPESSKILSTQDKNTEGQFELPQEALDQINSGTTVDENGTGDGE